MFVSREKKKTQLVPTMPQIGVEVNFKIVLTVVRGRIVASLQNINRDGNDANVVVDQNAQDANQRPRRAGAGQNPNLCDCDCHNAQNVNQRP